MALLHCGRGAPAKNEPDLRLSFLIASLMATSFSLWGCGGGKGGSSGSEELLAIGDGPPEPKPGAGLPTPFDPRPPSPPPATGPKVSSLEWEHFQLLNQLRSDGFSCPDGTWYPRNPVPLKFDCRLWRASQQHSQDMADCNYFCHTSRNGRSPWERARSNGCRCSGENIAAGCSSAEGVLNQWKRSCNHCRNMMSPSTKIFAIGYGYNGWSAYRHYWTQMFGSSGDDVGTLDTSCYPLGPGINGGIASTFGNATSSSGFLAPVANLTVGDAWTRNETVIDFGNGTVIDLEGGAAKDTANETDVAPSR